MKITVEKDFAPWWNMKKYQKRDIPARAFGSQEIRTQHGTNRGWPGPESDVQYWVETWDGMAIGFREPRTETGRRAKYAEFPVASMQTA